MNLIVKCYRYFLVENSFAMQTCTLKCSWDF